MLEEYTRIKTVLDNGENELAKALVLKGCTIAIRPFGRDAKITASYSREEGDDVAIKNIIEQLDKKIPEGCNVYIYGVFEDRENNDLYSFCAIEIEETPI